MRRHFYVSLLVALGLVVSACGGDTKTSSATTTSAPTTTTIPPASEDKAKAEKIVLTQADVGAGFTATVEEEGEEESPEADQAFRECSQNNPVLNSEAEDRAASSEFEKGQLTTVGSDVEFWTNEQEFKAAMDILASDAFVSCIDGAFSKLFSEMGGEQGVTVSNVKTTKRAVSAPGTDQSSGLATTLTMSAGGMRLNLFLDIVFMRKGRAGALVMATSAQQAYPAAEIDRLSGIVAQRLSANA